MDTLMAFAQSVNDGEDYEDKYWCAGGNLIPVRRELGPHRQRPWQDLRLCRYL